MQRVQRSLNSPQRSRHDGRSLSAGPQAGCCETLSVETSAQKQAHSVAMSSIVTPTGSTNQPGGAALVAPSARACEALVECQPPDVNLPESFVNFPQRRSHGEEHIGLIVLPLLCGSHRRRACPDPCRSR